MNSKIILKGVAESALKRASNSSITSKIISQLRHRGTTSGGTTSRATMCFGG